MDPNSNPNKSSAGRSQAVTDLLRQIQAQLAAGQDVDFAAILEAHPNLAAQLKPELEKLQRSHQTRTQSSEHTTTFISESQAQKPKIEISGYSMISEIGRGGQAIVYLAIQLSTGRKRALKVLREGAMADAQATARFQREINTLAALNHPNIVPIIDTGSTPDGNRFMVMDYIAGTSLDEFMKTRHRGSPDDPSSLLKLFWKICEAMKLAHRNGIVHRDLKPSNVIIDERGQPHILDFGLARTTLDRFIRGDSSLVSVTGEFLGSLPWSSPEQAEGDPDKIDIRTDVYSLGVILYQMLTGGKFPYEVVGNIRDVLNNILTARPTPPSKVIAAARARESQVNRRVAPHIPPVINQALENIVLKSLAKKPDQRYQNAGELGRDIYNYLAGQPTAKPASSTTGVWWCNRSLQYSAAGAIGALVVAAIGFVLYQRHSASPALPPPTVAIALPSTQPAAPQIEPAILPSTQPAKSPTPQTQPAPIKPQRNSSAQMVINGAAHLDGQDLVLTPRNAGACVFLFGDPDWSNYELTFKAIANAENGFNVWLHWTGSGNFEAFSPVNSILPNAWLRHDGVQERLLTRRSRLEPDRWCAIRMVVRGASVQFFIGGKIWFECADDRYTHGRIGFASRSGLARYRDIKVTGPDGTVLYSGPPDLSSLPAAVRDQPNPALVGPLHRTDLLSLVDAAKNALSGVWSLKDGLLNNAAGAKAQIEFPFVLPDEYCYRVEFTRTQGDAPITLIAADGGHRFDWVVGGLQNSVSGFEMFDGKPFDNNPTTVRFRDMLGNGRKHLLVLDVRKESVRGFIDGTLRSILKTNFDDLALNPSLKPSSNNYAGLCFEGDSVSVQTADILVNSEPKTAP